MKKLINKINSKVNQLAIRTKTALASKSGEGYATACAETQLWNQHFGRWVKRGATGIALIDGRGDKNYLKYCIAYDLGNGTSHTDIEDLSNDEVVDFDLFRVVCSAIAISVYGYPKANGKVFFFSPSSHSNPLYDQFTDRREYKRLSYIYIPKRSW